MTPDVKKHTALVRSASPGGILSVATRGDLARSPRWAELLGPEGIGDELRVALVQGGAYWGPLTLYWERTSGRFMENRAPVVRGLLPLLAAGLRQGLAVLPPQIEETGAGLACFSSDLTWRPW
jgi:hypothetical protein